MPMWAQHGYGKGQKIHDLAESAMLEGVVVSPWNEPSAVSIGEHLTSQGLSALLDPQAYVHALQRPKGSVVSGHERFELHPGPPITWDLSADLDEYLDRIVTANAALGSRAIIAPGCVQAFTDAWAPLSFHCAREIRRKVGRGTEILASLIVHERAFDGWADAERWLTLATQPKRSASGYYIVMARDLGSESYPFPVSALRTTGLLRLIHRLAVVNEKHVVYGYSDVEGLLAIASGADAFATGWSYRLRAFDQAQWQERPPGGRSPRPRIFIPEMLSPVDVDEARQMLAIPAFRALVPPAYQTHVRTGTVTQLEAQMSFLHGMGALAGAIEDEDEVSDRLDLVGEMLVHANATLRRVSAQMPTLNPTYRNRIRGLSSALDAFRQEEDI